MNTHAEKIKELDQKLFLLEKEKKEILLLKEKLKSLFDAIKDDERFSDLKISWDRSGLYLKSIYLPSKEIKLHGNRSAEVSSSFRHSTSFMISHNLISSDDEGEVYLQGFLEFPKNAFCSSVSTGYVFIGSMHRSEDFNVKFYPNEDTKEILGTIGFPVKLLRKAIKEACQYMDCSASDLGYSVLRSS